MKQKFKQAAVITIMLITALAFTLEPASAETKKTTVYSDVFVSGDIAYCCCDLGILRVNKKTGKKKYLAKGSGFYAMKKKGKWLYFLEQNPIGSTLHRVNKNTGKGKTLKKYCVESYVVTKKKVYFKGETWDNVSDGKSMRYFKMKKCLKSVKKTSVKAKMRRKSSNKKGYKILSRDSGDYIKFWLKTPKKKIYLGKAEKDNW